MNYLFYTGTNIISLVRFLIQRVIKQLCETDTVVRTTTARPWRRDKEKKLNTDNNISNNGLRPPSSNSIISVDKNDKPNLCCCLTYINKIHKQTVMLTYINILL